MDLRRATTRQLGELQAMRQGSDTKRLWASPPRHGVRALTGPWGSRCCSAEKRATAALHFKQHEPWVDIGKVEVHIDQSGNWLGNLPPRFRMTGTLEMWTYIFTSAPFRCIYI